MPVHNWVLNRKKTGSFLTIFLALDITFVLMWPIRWKSQTRCKSQSGADGHLVDRYNLGAFTLWTTISAHWILGMLLPPFCQSQVIHMCACQRNNINWQILGWYPPLPPPQIYQIIKTMTVTCCHHHHQKHYIWQPQNNMNSLEWHGATLNATSTCCQWSY